MSRYCYALSFVLFFAGLCSLSSCGRRAHTKWEVTAYQNNRDVYKTILTEISQQKDVSGCIMPDDRSLVTVGIKGVNHEGFYSEGSNDFYGGDTHLWSAEERALILLWYQKLKRLDLYGFGASDSEVSLFVSPSLRLIFSRPPFPIEYERYTSQGRTPSGNRFMSLGDGVYITEE